MTTLYVFAVALSLAVPTPQRAQVARPARDASHVSAHPFILGIEAGHNGLVSVGGIVGYVVGPHLTVEGGIGYGDAGLKVGTRLRAHLFAGDFSPFAAVGLSLASGTWGNTVDIVDKDDELPARFRVSVSPYGQAVVGLRQRIDEFELVVMAGWSQLLREKNITWVAAPTPFQKRTYPGRVDSGVVLALNASYAF